MLLSRSLRLLGRRWDMEMRDPGPVALGSRVMVKEKSGEEERA